MDENIAIMNRYESVQKWKISGVGLVLLVVEIFREWFVSGSLYTSSLTVRSNALIMLAPAPM